MYFRTSGAWGSGSSGDLTPAEVDQNFWQLIQMVNAKATAGVGIAAFNIVGDELWVTLTDHTILGPYILPVVSISFVGPWQPNTQYLVNQIFTNNGSTYIVVINVVSADTFDPGANDGMGHDYYGLLLSPADGGLPAGGAAGMALEKTTSADYAVGWVWPTFESLHDVLPSPAPHAGQLVYWNGSAFSYISQSAVVGSPPALLELSDVQSSPGPITGQVVTWNGLAFDFETPAAAGPTTFQTLNDVLASPSPTTSQIVYWNGSKFTYETLTSSLLTDASLASLGQWDAFSYDLANARWTNRQPLVYNSGHSGTFTLALADAQNLIDIATGGAITIPTNASVPFSIGNAIWFRQSATTSSPFSFSPAGGVTLNVVLGRIAQPRAIGSIVMLQKTATNTWEVSGDLAYDSTSSISGSSGTVSIDDRLTDSETYTWTPATNQTMNIVSGGAPFGKKLTLIITTAGTSSWTLTFGTNMKSQGTLATGTVAGKVFVVGFLGDGTNFNEVSRTTAM